jgi:transporter family-2 protein
MIKAYQLLLGKPVKVKETLMIWMLIGCIGFLSVYQGGMNRLMTNDWGLPGTVLMNALVFLLASALFFFGLQWGWFPATSVFQNLAPFQKIKFWHWLPGLFGFFFVLGVPMAISRVGAVLTFIALVLAQIMAGSSWDYFTEGKSLGPQKILGLAIAGVGIWIATREK